LIMKLGLIGGYGGKMIQVDIERIKYAEDLGYDSIWTAEAYGADAVTPAALILAQTDKNQGRHLHYANARAITRL